MAALVPFLIAGTTGRYIMMGGVCGNDRMFCGMLSGGGGCNILTAAVPPASSGDDDGSTAAWEGSGVTEPVVVVDDIADKVTVVVVDDEPDWAGDSCDRTSDDGRGDGDGVVVVEVVDDGLVSCSRLVVSMTAAGFPLSSGFVGTSEQMEGKKGLVHAVLLVCGDA